MNRRKISKYLSISSIIVAVLIAIFYILFCDFGKSLDYVYKIVQILAILMGGFWAYETFFLHKKIDSAIKIRRSLEGYEFRFNNLLASYRIKKDWFAYGSSIIPMYNEFVITIKSTSYLPNQLKSDLNKLIFLSLNKGKSNLNKEIDGGDFGANLKEFSELSADIKNKLDLIINNHS